MFDITSGRPASAAHFPLCQAVLAVPAGREPAAARAAGLLCPQAGSGTVSLVMTTNLLRPVNGFTIQARLLSAGSAVAQ
ncbi:hypothetical protein AB0O31_32880 [Kitasatospora cineracea]|uniref:hypothetical protein n=1 Tax=Kitasatospora cineracea TaxID=88074 RepID=UPI00341ADE2A